MLFLVPRFRDISTVSHPFSFVDVLVPYPNNSAGNMVPGEPEMTMSESENRLSPALGMRGEHQLAEL
jgi:hypothetical protein